MNDVLVSVPRKFIPYAVLAFLVKVLGSDLLATNPFKWVLLKEISQRALLEETRPKGRH
jgi:MFS superfamily sulfate permease-like transporter